jgi:hypothetical protein
MQFTIENPSLEFRLIGDIVKGCPQLSKIMERYFGKECLNKPGSRIKTLGMACILLGLNQKQLLQEFDKTQNG